MKADKQHSALEVIKKEQLKRRVFSVEFKAEVVRYKKAEPPFVSKPPDFFGLGTAAWVFGFRQKVL